MFKVIEGGSNKTTTYNEFALPPTVELTPEKQAILDAVLSKDHEKVAELVAIYKKNNHNVVQLPRKPIEQFFVEESQRIRNNLKNGNSDSVFADKTLLAIIEGNDQEADRLLGIAAKMNKQSLRSIK